ncbi:MAG TPA: hypothetical protein VFW65_21905 [Pseudonocardiaceae bacterium]|nr:hypothetical protein [Pseudonocardiaceae bacterium]
MVLTFLALSQPLADAAPVDVNTVPDTLRQYVVGTPEWATSPWMTTATCQDRGGDWSVYTRNVLKDTPALLQFFQPDFAGSDDVAKPRGAEILQGYRDIAAQVMVPAGYCVNQVKQWAGADPSYKPFGFGWGNATNTPHHSDYDCTNNVGADNAPCGGFYISCTGSITPQDRRLCDTWNTFSDDYVRRVDATRTKALDDYPATGRAPVIVRPKSPSEIMQDLLNWTVQHGMKQVVSFVIDGVTKLWAAFLTIAVDYATPNATGYGFADVYNLVAGIALALAFLGWLFTLATSWKQGRLQFSLLGGIKAAVGVTLAGVGAILMLQLADDCTRSLAQAGGDLAHQADFTTDLAKANPLVALVAGVLIAIFLIFAIIFLVIHSALVLMWALMGSVAAAGQVHPASSGWLARWASRLTALAWAKFAMVAVMLLAQALLLPLDAGEDTIKQIVDVVQGLALSFLLVTTPYLLWELVDFVGDRIGGAAAVGGRAGQIATNHASAVGGRIGSAGGSAVTTAVSTMMASAADLGRRFAGGATSGDNRSMGRSGSASRAAMPPRADEASGTSVGTGSAGGYGGSGDHDQKSSGGSSPRPLGSAGQPDVANRGQVYAGAPPMTDLQPSTRTPTGAGGSSENERGTAGSAGRVPPVPPA